MLGNSNLDKEAQDTLDSIAIQDVDTLNSLEIAAATIAELKSKGVNTIGFENEVNKIFREVSNRQEEMKNSAETGKWGKVTNAIGNTWNNIKSFFGLKGVGSITATVVILVIAVAVGAGATAIVLVKPWKDKSGSSFKACKDLQALLNQADPATALKIQQNIQKQQDDAVTLMKRKLKLEQFFSKGKWIFIIGGALIFLPSILGYIGNVRKQAKEIKSK